MKKGVKILLIVIALVIILFFLFLMVKRNTGGVYLTCNDGTMIGECTANAPYYCHWDGKLISNATYCGCPTVLTQEGDECISEYETNAKNISLNYTLNGITHRIPFVAYEGIVTYLSELPLSITYLGGETPSRADFKLRNINEEQQRELLLPLVIDIQNLHRSKVSQARVAISLVQNIEYGASEKTISFGGQEADYSRYPYEVLFDRQGICGEKTELLAFLLKELGYGTAFFYHELENHESLGVKCASSRDFWNSEYCFVETTGPSIITDGSIEYVGGITLDSVPEIHVLSEGEYLPKGMYEYGDAKDMEKIRQGGFLLNKEERLLELEQKYGLVDEYHPG